MSPPLPRISLLRPLLNNDGVMNTLRNNVMKKLPLLAKTA